MQLLSAQVLESVSARQLHSSQFQDMLHGCLERLTRASTFDRRPSAMDPLLTADSDQSMYQLPYGALAPAVARGTPASTYLGFSSALHASAAPAPASVPAPPPVAVPPLANVAAAGVLPVDFVSKKKKEKDGSRHTLFAICVFLCSSLIVLITAGFASARERKPWPGG